MKTRFDENPLHPVFDNENITYFYTKQATSMRRSTVLSLPFELVFPGALK
jgi:hypothetical protein